MLEIVHINKNYNDKLLLMDINLKISSNEIVGLVGKNGVGKSTLMKLIAGIEQADAGDIKINGKSIYKNTIAAKYNLGYVTDIPSLYLLLTGKEYLEFIADLWNLNKEIKKEKVSYFLKIFNLNDIENELIETYSLGTKQKIALAAALIHNPKLLILDEPLTGIDMQTITVILNIIKDYAKNGGAVLLTSHIFQIIESLCSRIIILSENKLHEWKMEKGIPLQKKALVKLMSISTS